MGGPQNSLVMKKILFSLSLVFLVFIASAQGIFSNLNLPNYIDNYGDVTFLDYTDEDGTYGIYLVIDQNFPVASYKDIDGSKTTINRYEGATILVGQSCDDVMSFLNDLMALVDADLGAYCNIPANTQPIS